MLNSGDRLERDIIYAAGWVADDGEFCVGCGRPSPDPEDPVQHVVRDYDEFCPACDPGVAA